MTGRLPFDPQRARGGRGARPASPDAPLTPSQVNDLVQGAIAQHVPRTLHVLGQIADLSRPHSGHIYFTLKDARGELRVVMWRSDAARLKFELADGLEIIATGTIEVYTPRGQYQLMARKLEPRGVGALELAFRQLCEKLEKEGLFATQRKRPIPARPRRIGLVTSPSGAAIHDILRTAQRRYPLTEFLVFPVRVQGDGAAEEIAAAVRRANRVSGQIGGLDVLIVTRGGGSIEDLWPFNEEIVARAIVDSEIPIISAVGHEVDVTISDMAADARAATPTAAAEMITPDIRAVLGAIHEQQSRIARIALHALERAALRLRGIERGEIIGRPERYLGDLRGALSRVEERAARALRARMDRAAARLGRCDTAVIRFGAGAGFALQRRRVEARAAQLERGLERVAMRRKLTLEALENRVRQADPRRSLPARAAALAVTRKRVERATQILLRDARNRLAARFDAIEARDPAHVLRRGYSMTRDAKTGAVIRSVEQIRDGARIVTRVADGEFRSTADDPRQPRLFD